MASGRIINIVSRGGGGVHATDLPGFLNDMSLVPGPARDRSVIAVSTLRHVREVYRLKDDLDHATVFLSVSTGDVDMLARVNHERWQGPVIIVGSLHTLAYEIELNRVGKIAFYGSAALLPSQHPIRERIENKLHTGA